METLSLETSVPAPRQVWWDLLAKDKNALIFQTPAWLDCICNMGPYEDASHLYETTHGRQIVLPMVRHKNLPGSFASKASLPHGWGMGGPIAENGIEKEEAALIIKDLIDQSSLRTSLRPNPYTAGIWQTVVPKDIATVPHITHILDLTGGFERVWAKRFKSATRNKIRKAEKSGLDVEIDITGQLVPVFYDLYMRWIERRARERRMPLWIGRYLGRWREPYKKVKLVSDTFNEACRIYVAKHEGVPVAASILLIYKEQAFYWRNASIKELMRKTRANDLLQKLMIDDACRVGCRNYHMGESGGVESLMYFKSRFGAEKFCYVEYSLEKIAFSRAQQHLLGVTGWLENLLIRSSGKRVNGI